MDSQRSVCETLCKFLAPNLAIKHEVNIQYVLNSRKAGVFIARTFSTVITKFKVLFRVTVYGMINSLALIGPV
jgi:hypothetical protein